MGQRCSKESGNVKGNGTAIEVSLVEPKQFSSNCRSPCVKSLWKIGGRHNRLYNPERLRVVELIEYGTSGVMNNFLEAVVTHRPPPI
jgi:hypothetical protein